MCICTLECYIIMSNIILKNISVVLQVILCRVDISLIKEEQVCSTHQYEYFLRCIVYFYFVFENLISNCVNSIFLHV